jgi:signal transduction histidine kinase
MTDKLRATYEKLEKRTQELELTNKELKDAQFRLVQSTKMAAIGQLGAGVAHELNNPLAGILGYAQYTLQKVKKPEFSPEDFRACQTYLEYIEREALRSKTIVENLLKFSRGPKGEMEDVDLNKVIRDTMPLTGHGLRTRKINIIENYDPDLPAVRGNFNKLQQVMVNMIINAEQAMPEDGQLKLSTKTKKDSSGKPNAVIVEMEDTGCGIPPEHLSRLFEPFFTTKQDAKGTGLGLTVSYEIIQEHRGEIEVQSQVGKGTKFTITIPC